MDQSDLYADTSWIELSTLVDDLIHSISKNPDAEASGSLGGKEKTKAHSLPLSAAAALYAATEGRCETVSPALNESGQTYEGQTEHADRCDNDRDAGPCRDIDVKIKIVVFHRVTLRLIS